ncbi:MgtC/SapB family protein [Martelella lutilitoris]|uniref:Protein MgtC n=1 Tax=Martelella lutilitoris TaxID=2583532 RepID=A0A7T7HII8_9HYPH|nr:MgtC/SapB family protein [Martelella lutilitoris]QQM29836.1 MgtC/SapB family protein [Martelella lutilitoris]
MNFLNTFQLFPILDSALSLIIGFICGTAIGAERQYRQRSAGVRTNALVAIGAAAFVDLGQRVAGDVEAVRVISYVVSGIGFLGAGVIMKEGYNVRGLNTAATLWCSAAAGACAGSDMLAEAVLVTIVVLAANTLLHPVADRINRLPLNPNAGEAMFVVRVVTSQDRISAVRRQLFEELDRARYPVRDIEIEEREDGLVEIGATLVRTAVIHSEIDTLVAGMVRWPGVANAYWENEAAD